MIVLPRSVRDEIVEEARTGAPAEVCGVLGGTFDSDQSRVRSSYPAENAAERPRTRYEIDPEEQLAIFERIEHEGQEIVGFYHSHPQGSAEPSATDAAQATWPDRSYVIVSLAEREPTIGSWRWRNERSDRRRGQFRQERVSIV